MLKQEKKEKPVTLKLFALNSVLMFISVIYSDVDDHFKNTKQVFEELSLPQYTEEDCRIVQHVCCLVSTRAAYLASAGVCRYS